MRNILDEIEKIKRALEKAVENADDKPALESIHNLYLGRKGELTKISRSLRDIDAGLRPKVGAELNKLKSVFNQRIQDKLELLDASDSGAKSDFFDYTLPGRRSFVGRYHPLMQTVDRIVRIFRGMGFSIASGPDIETDFNNFDALNTPDDHPARDLSDTFYIGKGVLLRTHTSTVQVRTMQAKKPPIRIIAPGRCYRSDAFDASHSPVFYQCEGLFVDERVTFGDLKGVIIQFAKELFGSDIKVRFRPHFFPFTEPSAEYDFSCMICGGKGCRVCKKTGWLEISGAGMVDPEVFKAVGYDPEKYTGFAFGMGVDRITMLRYRMGDIRHLYDNDIRFLRQF